MIKIKNWKTGEVIHSGDFDTVNECIEQGLKEGVSFYNATLSYANLSGVNLKNANLSGAYLSNADLSGANLRNADLSYAVLSYVNLSYATLSYANLSDADFSYANLRNAKGILPFKAKNSGRMFYIVDGEEIKVKAGCFWGTIQELKNRINEEDKEETHKDYLMACDWAEWSFKK